jgi:hypothetical protein
VDPTVPTVPAFPTNPEAPAIPALPVLGYRYEWQDLLDPSRRGHLYLFEFHPNP